MGQRFQTAEKNGRHDWTRTSDLYRVNEVDNLEPFVRIALPHFAMQKRLKTAKVW